jgi:hypothetical protein
MLELRSGKSKYSFGQDSKTKGATVTFTKTFGGPKMKTVVCAEVWAKPLEVGNLRGSSNDSLGSIRFRI